MSEAEVARLAVVQMTSIDDVETNLRSVHLALDEIESGGPCDLACFPENALYFKVGDDDAYPTFRLEDECFLELGHRARKMGTSIHLGSVPISYGHEKPFATSVLVGSAGQARAGYRKIHLFDVDVENHSPVRESDAFMRGTGPSILRVGQWTFGESICYDIRFAELYSIYAKANVDAVLIPAAFISPTGQAHWETLCRARAIESQCYVIAAAQGGIHRGRAGGERRTWGHSIAFDPWGRKLAECEQISDEPQTLRVELTRDRITQARNQIPMASHRRRLGLT